MPEPVMYNYYMSFNYLEKSAKNRTLKYIEQLLKKHDSTFAAGRELNALPDKARSHVTSELDRILDSDKKFKAYTSDDDYGAIASTNFARSSDSARAAETPRLGIYDVSHVPSYASQSLAKHGTPSLRAATNNVPGKLPLTSRLLGNSLVLNKLQVAPRYRMQRTDVPYSPERLQEIRGLKRNGSILTHADNPMYEAVFASRGKNAPRLAQDLFGIKSPLFRSSDASVADILRKRFGEDSVHTIDSLVESMHPSKVYHGGSSTTSIPGSAGYDGRRMVETANDVADQSVGMHAHKINVLANSLKNLPEQIKNKIMSKLVKNLLNGGLYLMRRGADRADNITKGKSWFSPLPHVGVSYANYNSGMFGAADTFVPQNVFYTVLRDGARLANSDWKRINKLKWLRSGIDN